MQPTEKDAERILFETTGKGVADIKRFETGLANFVYDVITTDGEKLVVRLGTPQAKPNFEGALYWHPVLKNIGVPLPNLYFGNVSGQFPMMIMERLEGRDLGDIYTTLNHDQKEMLAEQIISIQNKVSRLPEGDGYGYIRSSTEKPLLPKWVDVLNANLDRSAKRTKYEITDFIQETKGKISAHHNYFDAVRPTCFLDDTTTKNVLVENGNLSGIVDVDGVAFGDPLLTVALTQTSLLSSGYDIEYTDYWIRKLDTTSEQRTAIDLYTRIFCLDFLSESGNVFNTDKEISMDSHRAERLMSILKS